MGRVIAVGDRNQAIYGFRGAHTGSMDELKERFAMRELPLSISYRCPRKVVEHAQGWVPQMQSHEAAIDGYVGPSGTDWKAVSNQPAFDNSITRWHGIEHFIPGDVILCRLTRPLVAAAFALIHLRIPARVLGREIGQGLVSLVKRVCRRGRLEALDGLAAFREALDEYWAAEREKLAERDKKWEIARLEDQVSTLKVFMDGMEEDNHGRTGDADRTDNNSLVAGGEATISGLAQEIERLFTDDGGNGVTLSTVHRAKGLEWNRVFVLDAGELMPWKWAIQPWELQQEQNLMYVAATRSKRELRYITSWELGIGKGDI